MDKQLVNGSRVGIIGGGPAGSLSALHLLQFARKKGIDLEVTIFEPRDYAAPGPRGCKGCAGILSTRMLNGLASLELSLSKEVIQSELHAYVVHVDGEIIKITQPDARRRIVSVYRGAGPHQMTGEASASLDHYLLTQACLRGARHVQTSVREVTQDKGMVVSTARESYPVDLVVLATGVSCNNPLAPSFRYKGPATEIMVQDEVMRPEYWPPDEVHVYLKQPPGIIFGVLIPKGRCLNVSLLGHGLTQDAVARFIDSVERDPELPELTGMCGCAPRIAVTPARAFFGDRWVAVGDAAATRLYKDGIGSAFFTAKTAMRVAISEGISKGDFRRGYLPYCKRIAVDNLYGQLLFRLWELTLRTPFLLGSWKHAVDCELDFPIEQRIHRRILWGMLTGDEPYRDLALLFLRRPAMRGMWVGIRQTI